MTQVEEIEAQKKALLAEGKLRVAFTLERDIGRVDAARLRSQVPLTGTAFTKSEQLQLGEATKLPITR